MESDDDDAADNANRSGCSGRPPPRSRLVASRIAVLLDWVRGGQGNGR